MTSCTAPPRLHAHFMHVIPFIQSHPLITTSGIRSSQRQASAHHNIKPPLITTSRIYSSQHHASAHHNITHPLITTTRIRSSQQHASLITTSSISQLSPLISHLASRISQLSTLNSQLSSLISHCASHHLPLVAIPQRDATRRDATDIDTHAALSTQRGPCFDV